jgi:hypothetical protein
MSFVKTQKNWLAALVLTLPLAAHGFMFDPDGEREGGVDAVDMDAFDVTQSSILNADGVTAFLEGVGGKLTSYNHGNISALTLDGAPVFSPLAAGYNCEITIVLGLDTEITDVSVDGLSITSEYDPAGSVNFFEMWYDDTCDSDPLAGTGFNDGTLIASGRFTSLFSTFTATDRVNYEPLDGLTRDDWEPVVTISGSGSSNNVRIRIESFDPTFFPDMNSGDVVIMAFQNYSQSLPYTTTNPSELYTEGPGGVETALAPTIGANTGNDGNFAINGIEGPDLIAQTDVNISLNSTPVVRSGACRMTGGNATVAPVIGTDERDTWTYDFEVASDEQGFDGSWITTGGQINAPSGNTPVSGHWVHSQHGGANGGFSFHAGTSSAPAGTEISSVECADPGWCVQARCAPFKQLFWTGVGNFANQHYSGVFPGCPVTKGNKGTLHRVEVMIGDFGENDNPTRKEGYLPDQDPENCNWSENLAADGYAFPTDMPWTAADAVPLSSTPDPKFGYRDGQICDKCPDYYQIRIFCDESASSDVIYEFAGYLQHGNYQIHPETGEQCPATPQLSSELFETSTIDDTPTTENGNGKGRKK